MRSLSRRLRLQFAGLFLATVCAANAQSYAFTRLAGQSPLGCQDGPGPQASFRSPRSAAIDTAGYLYISDRSNGLIRKISPDGFVTTVAGIPRVFGHQDGPATTATLGKIDAITITTAGVLFVVEDNLTIRRISSAGVVSTIVTTDQNGAPLQLPEIKDLVADASDNLYVALSDQTIRKISAKGIVTLVAGFPTPNEYSSMRRVVDGKVTQALFANVTSITIDRSGNLFVGESGSPVIRKITSDSVVKTVVAQSASFGTSDSPPHIESKFGLPLRLTCDSDGSLYVAADNRIWKLAADSTFTVVAGMDLTGYADGPAASARFYGATGVAARGGVVYVVDSNNSLIRKIADGSVSTFAGTPGVGYDDGFRAEARFSYPYGIDVDSSGNLYVADSSNATIRKITPDGTVSTIAGAARLTNSVNGPGPSARFYDPRGLTVARNGDILVADPRTREIRRIDTKNVVTTAAGRFGSGSSTISDGPASMATFSQPMDVAEDTSGNVYIADQTRIRKLSPDGMVSTVAGSVFQGAVDGQGWGVEFSSPAALAVGPDGNIYIADTGNHTIRRMTPTGLVTTIAGKAEEAGFVDGTASDARFSFPRGISVLADGSIIVADAGNFAVRKIGTAGMVTTLGGSGAGGNADGIGAAAILGNIAGLATDPAGNIYTVDVGNQQVIKASVVRPASATSALANLSVRAQLQSNDRLIAGIVTTGSQMRALIRGIGPGLAPFLGAANVVPDPRLDLYGSAGEKAASNDNWGGSADYVSLFASVGAFGLQTDSRDAALLHSGSGAYTVHLQSADAGTALLEAYNAGADSSARFINLSARHLVAKGEGGLIAGFAISGTYQKTVLIRGVGPALAKLGVSGALTNPSVTLYDGKQRIVAQNDDWAASLTTTFAAVGAFAFPDGSKDAALLISLPPGSYTAVLSDSSGAGEGLIEIYDVGN